MQNEKKFYTAKYDRVFKTVLCDEDNLDLLREFLSRILKKNVEIIEFLRNELPIHTTLEKVKTVDVLVKADGEYIHIEMNGSFPPYLHIRNFIYFSTLYSKKVQRGEDYDIKTRFLHLDFTYGLENCDEEYVIYHIQDKRGRKYLENIEIIEYNMDKIMNYWYNGDKEKIQEYKHLIMLDLKTKDLKLLSKGDDFVEEFSKKVTDLNKNETFQSAMTYEEDQKLILNTEKKISFEEGVEQGEERGIDRRNTEIAKSMIFKDIDIQTISECTGLSIEKIEKLRMEI